MSDIEQQRREAERVYAEAELIYTPAEVDAAIDRMAKEIALVLADKNPVILCLMIGAIIPAGLLLAKLHFPLQIDYVHLTRYHGDTAGGEIKWLRKPGLDLAGRTILLFDDILDEGITLSVLIAACKELRAGKIYTAVLTDKQINRSRALDHADFTGLRIPDRYVFGYGMDYKGFLRNVPGIFAVRMT